MDKTWKYFDGNKTHYAFESTDGFFSDGEHTFCGKRTGRTLRNARDNPTNREVDCERCLKWAKEGSDVK